MTTSRLLILLAAVAGGIVLVWFAPARLLALLGGTAAQVPVQAPALVAEPEGELHFDNTDVNLGVVKEPTVYRFRCTNRSDVPVRIRDIKSSCSCTVSTPERKDIAPGQSAFIEVKITPRIERVGAQAFSIEVPYEGAEVRTQHLFVLCQFRPDLVVPEVVQFTCTQGRSASATLDVTDYRDQPLKITHISTSSPALEARALEEPTKWLPGWRFRFAVRWTPERAAPGFLQEAITLDTTEPAHKQIVIPVHIQVLDRIRVSPEVLYVAGAGLTVGKGAGVIRLTDREGCPVELESVTCSHENIQCKRLPIEGGGQRVEVGVTAATGRTQDQPVITIQIRKPVVETVKVPVIVRPASN